MQEVIKLIEKKGIVENVKRINSLGYLVYKKYDGDMVVQEAMYEGIKKILKEAVERDEEIISMIKKKGFFINKIIDQIMAHEDFTPEELEIGNLDPIEKIGIVVSILKLKDESIDKFIEALLK